MDGRSLGEAGISGSTVPKLKHDDMPQRYKPGVAEPYEDSMSTLVGAHEVAALLILIETFLKENLPHYYIRVLHPRLKSTTTS